MRRDLAVMIGAGQTVATFSYDATAPYVVTMRVVDGAGPVTWLLGREVLAEALVTGRAGVGDVRVTARGDLVVLGLSTPDGVGTAVLRRDDVAVLVALTHQIVRPGAESDALDWSDLAQFPGVSSS
ncbi:SsgA family sporulation/cell division regulator [Amycolatopsis sp. H20-H5]|uniref:SsgA family sporulation/cell division regulator n=1 Tax=Amycolatopsis sp. H20-H5 TaxID=3046309 RepID=UPI002DBF68B3|nr:SsgA family sporulation/cell division regulator [Amycolatopsis sp. H20-H5]MEC3974574.1 SsgA family sporulation/cell division regulator [Amycolatopsis sp. H20-H5]